MSNAQCGGGFLDNLYTYGDVKTAELWRGRMLDLSTARQVEEAYYRLDSASQDEWFIKWATKEEFDLWWGKAGAEMERAFGGGGK
ncbi:MAG: hypothetical protein ACTHN5_23255 [Phycisphaerae bacterium]